MLLCPSSLWGKPRSLMVGLTELSLHNISGALSAGNGTFPSCPTALFFFFTLSPLYFAEHPARNIKAAGTFTSLLTTLCDILFSPGKKKKKNKTKDDITAELRCKALWRRDLGFSARNSSDYVSPNRTAETKLDSLAFQCSKVEFSPPFITHLSRYEYTYLSRLSFRY